MMNYEEGKRILKNDIKNLSFVNKKLRKEIDKDIEECLQKQEKEIDQLVDELNKMINIKFKSITEFKIFVVNNISLNTR